MNNNNSLLPVHPEPEEITISQLETLKQFSTNFARLGDHYICATIDSEDPMPDDMAVTRLDGIALILNIRGKLTIEVNTKTLTLQENQVMVLSPNSVISRCANEQLPVRTMFLFLSRNFIQNLNIDLTLISRTYHNSSSAPVITLEQRSIRMLSGYINMLRTNAETNSDAPDNILGKNIARTLTASLIYYMMQLASLHYDALNPDQIQSAGTRRTTYLREFITLVQQNFRKERTVSFYARKLFISPKYLSHLIKETTGQSAAEWIDQYVILEAKNLLRFSGMTVQQVAYTLNFNNQSAFGKYFKHLTGISPSAFQKK